MTEPTIHERPEVWLPRLRAVLEEQIGHYRELDALGEKQSGLIETGDAEGLIGVLAQRQMVIDRIAGLNGDLVPFQRGWDVLSTMISDEQRSEMRGKLDELAALVKRIGERDEADKQSLERKRDAVKRELNGLNQGKRAAQAYGVRGANAPTDVPLYQDRNG
ncbi:MAG: flagellar protein FlgN [Planctomycetota bacterium]